jgi:hypothetical protein
LATKRQDANKRRPRSRNLPGHNLEIDNKYKTVFENYSDCANCNKVIIPLLSLFLEFYLCFFHHSSFFCFINS